MTVSAQPSALRRTKWYEYLSRFLLGGAITVIAGLISKNYGPVIGGLFLAFPAIFPASATLVEKHKEKRGKGKQAGRDDAAMEAAGAVMGTLGLVAFAVVIWLLLPLHSLWLVLLCATGAWFLISVAVWKLWDSTHAKERVHAVLRA